MQINNLKNKYYNMPPKLRTGLRHFALTGLTIAGIAVATKNIKEDITKYRESLNKDTIELTEDSVQKDEIIKDTHTRWWKMIHHKHVFIH